MGYNEKDNRKAVIALDHDKTLSPFDIGKRYLSSHFPKVYQMFNAQGRDDEERFVDVVRKLRSGEYNEFIKNELGIDYNPEEDHGIELALMVLLESKYNGLTKKTIEDAVKNAARKNHMLKEGVEKFLKNDGYPTWISTAGIEEFLRELYKIYGIERHNNFYVVGTRLEYDGDKPVDIERKNGRYQKPENLKKDFELDGGKIIAVGDSSGDSKLLEYATKNGFAISSGEGAKEYSNIVVVGGDKNFYGEIAAIITAKGLLEDKKKKEILNELEEFFGRGSVIKFEISKGEVENPITDKVIDIVSYFSQR